ncbi:hypothetical protein C8J57DRAFT_1149876 [Mycena rebaudengoi]|nr:hypothetical protein C8J57DRAFT_1149876 [Mycena rebaudengoi]
MSLPLTNPSYTGTIVAFLIVFYLHLVRTLRWRRYRAVHDKYTPKYLARTLTPSEAQQVVGLAFAWDMPTLSQYALYVALFEASAIPTISKLFLATKQLSARRYADTELLIGTWLHCPMSGKPLGSPHDAPASDPRAAIALARVNWLHSHYNILNEDYLFTLGQFIFEPANWAARYGWRPHSSLERYASFVYWSEIGRKMGIRDIPNTPEEFRMWLDDYAETHIRPANSNRLVAEHTIGELLFPVPRAFGIRSFVEGFSRAMLNERTRAAMMQPSAPSYAAPTIQAFLSIIAFVQKHLMLPRGSAGGAVNPDMPRVLQTKGGLEVVARMHPRKFTSRPWYKPASSAPLGLGYLKDRFLKAVNWHDDVPSKKWGIAGYRLHEMGPLKYQKEGHDQVMDMAAKLQGCPVDEAWTAQRARDAEASAA